MREVIIELHVPQVRAVQARLSPLIRPAVPEDLPYILSTWLRPAWFSPAWRMIPHDVFFGTYRPVVISLLQRANTMVACDPECPEVIWGYATTEGPYLHWVHTKANLQGYGVATRLLRDRRIEHISHWTRSYRDTIGSKLPNVTYDPFVLFFGPNHRRQSNGIRQTRTSEQNRSRAAQD